MEQMWATSVSAVEPEEVYLRGYGVGSLIGRLPFAATTYLAVRGNIPTPGAARMMDAILCSVLDYGLKKPGTVAARYCVSANPSMTAGLATAVLSVGAYTLAPDESGQFILDTLAEAKSFQGSLDEAAEAQVERLVTVKGRVPGFGHPNFRFIDPRAQKLKLIAKENDVWGESCEWYEAVHRAFTTKINNPALVINEVGMMAAILVEMGFSPPEMTGIAIMSSLPGIIAHVSEEMRSGVRIRTLPESVIETTVTKSDIEQEMSEAGWNS